MTALVLSEETQVAEMVQDVFEEAGHICFTAKSVEEAEGILLSVVVDTMVLDIGAGNPRLVAWLDEVSRSRPELARCTVVVTGRPLEQDELSRLASYGADTLWRPFLLRHITDSTLLSRIEERRSARNGGSPREGSKPSGSRRGLDGDRGATSAKERE